MTRFFVWSAALFAVWLVAASPESASAQTLQFAAHRDYSSGYGPASIAVGDLNGDQRQDLAVALYFADSVAVLLGSASGGFLPPVTVYLGPGNNPRSVAIGDFNGDAAPDLIVANPTSNTIVLLPGNGTGTFQPAVTLTAGTGPSSVAAVDVNGDGRLDIVAANAGSNNVSVLLGNGNGTFQATQNFVSDASPGFVSTGDFNRDGRVDLAVANTAAGTVSILIGNGDGTFQTPRNTTVGASPWCVKVGDFNGDSMQDLVTANNGANTVSVLLGNGDGTFRAPLTAAVGNGPTSVAAADFNRDGRSDLAVTSYNPAISTGRFVSVMLGNGDGTFQSPTLFPAAYESWAVATGDFNADGSPDMALANTFSTTVSVLLGRGDGTFPAPPSYPAGRNAESIVSGDFNRDGRRDLATANAGSNTVSVLLGNGDGTFQSALTFDAGRGPTAIATGDFNRDGITDFVVTNYGSSNYYQDIVTTTVSVLLGNGDGTFQAPAAYEAGSGPNDVAVGDLNGDGIQDLAVADYGPNSTRATTVAVLLGIGNGTFGPPTMFTVGNAASCVTIGDFNRDGRQDLAVCNYQSNNVSILLGAGNGTFQAASNLPVGTAPWDALVADVNGDQLPDLVVTSHWSDIVSVILGNGDGTFQPHRWYLTDRGPTGVILIDLNGDGRADIVTANYFSTSLSVLLGNADGTFQPAQNFGADLAPMSVTVADFNGDGQPDLAAANYFAHTVSVLINRTSAVARVATPTFNPQGGAYIGSVSVSLSTATSGATIRYTTDGSTPTSSSPVYTSPIAVSQTMTIKAIAMMTGMSDSDVATATYTIQQQQQQAAAPTFNPPGGSYTGSVTVSLSTTTAGATIRYTTDGSAPTSSSPVYTTPIAVSQTTTIRAIAMASGMTDSDIATATYTIQQQQAATPTFNPPGGTYIDSVSVSLSTTTSGATIRYTTDGSTPTTSSPIYSTPLTITQTTTVRTMASMNGMSDSEVASATYTIQQQVAPPTFNPPGGNYIGSATVSLSTATSGATIRYTTDGTTPTSSSPAYTGPLTLTRTTTVRAIGTAAGMVDSTVSSAVYTVAVVAPTFSPVGGNYVGSVTVSLSTTTTGATIRYTTDGTTPTSSSPAYAGPFTLTRTTTVRAIAMATGMVDSSVSTAIYNVAAVAPTFSPAPGTFNQPQNVTLSTTTPGATIYYTTDGTVPTTLSTRYTGPIAVTRTTTINAISTAAGMANSSVATATYTLQAATPTFSPAGGSYLLPQFVSISSASPGVTIYYTTDGSTPTTSSTEYTGAFLVGLGTTTVRAIAVAPGWSQSVVATARYVIGL